MARLDEASSRNLQTAAAFSDDQLELSVQRGFLWLLSWQSYSVKQAEQTGAAIFERPIRNLGTVTARTSKGTSGRPAR
jgi:hypothetical protein